MHGEREPRIRVNFIAQWLKWSLKIREQCYNDITIGTTVTTLSVLLFDAVFYASVNGRKKNICFKFFGYKIIDKNRSEE